MVPQVVELVHEVDGEPLLAMLVRGLQRVTLVSLASTKEGAFKVQSSPSYFRPLLLCHI